MSDRHALLIGVPRYDDDRLNDDVRLADAVRSDIKAMREALEASGYLVSECGLREEGGATLSRIRGAIEKACAAVPADGVLVVFFSGHGIAIDGVDYLVPSDAYRKRAAASSGEQRPRSGPTRPPLARSGLLRVVPDEENDDFLRDCQARLVVFIVDACRDEESGLAVQVEPGGRQPYLADGGQFVLLMGCGVGQICQFDETGSMFTQSLAKSLDPGSPGRTLRAVVDDVTADLTRRCRQSQGELQEPVVRNPRELESAGPVEICDGDEVTESWRKAVGGSCLFELCADDQEQVQSIIEACAHRFREAQDTLRGRTGLIDAWTDQDYPGRVLRFTELLLREAGLLPDGLSQGEASMLITAPFLRERVLAEGLKVAAGIDPANFERTYRIGARTELELTHETHQRIVRRAIGLREHNQEEAADRLAMWLVHQWLSDRESGWESAGAKEAYGLACPLIRDCVSSVGNSEIPRLVRALVLVIGAELADERLVRRLATSAYVNDRWRLLAAVLWLAGILAADLRSLPRAVADLVGTRMELPLSDVRAKARSAVWTSGPDRTLDLALVCEHPALHDAFEDIGLRATAAAETIAMRFALSDVSADRLPRGFTTGGLRPATRHDDHPAYDVPLARFQIAEEKVRELLMGRQLYGQPELAIRELYQNALDACRWRATRQRYLSESGAAPAPWTARIRFTQGVEDDGRPYIDCEDNGVGMDLGTLKHIFANAGERFVHGQEFRAEQADWAAKGLRMVSNSQFGVGVFSYFMLADEITVVTRHQGRDGIIDRQAYEVQIASSGSLFQIRPTSGMTAGGTRVRLYLSGDVEGISALKTLRDLLWVSEHRVEVTEPGDSEVWPAGELRYTGGGERPLKCGSDFWWVPGNGGLVADGIRTGLEVPGMVANLRGEHRPQFTVDRQTLSAWDKDWVNGLADESLPQLMRWPGFTLAWLWDVAAGGTGDRVWHGDVSLAQRIFEFAVETEAEVVVRSREDVTVPLGAIGCMPRDKELFFPDEGRYPRNFPEILDGWRESVWRNLGLPTKKSLGKEIPLIRIDGYPVPTPVEGFILARLVGGGNPWPTAEAIRGVAESVGYSGPEVLRRLRRFAIAGLDLARLKPSRDVDSRRGNQDADLLDALAPWPPPETVNDAELVTRLIQGIVAYRDYRVGEARGQFDATLDHLQELSSARWPGQVSDLRTLITGICPGIWRVLEAAPALVRSVIRGEVISPAEVVDYCRMYNMSANELLEYCDVLSPLCVVVECRESYPDVLNEIELDALGCVWAPGKWLTPLELAEIADQANVSIGSAHAALAGLENRGMLRRPKLDNRSDNVQSRYKRARDRIEDSNIHQEYPLWSCVVQIIVYGEAYYGSEEEDVDGQLLAAARELAYLNPPNTLAPAELAGLAQRLRVTLGEAHRAFQEVYPDARVGPLPPECVNLTVPHSLSEALLEHGEEYEAPNWRAGPGDLVALAANTGRSLGDCLSQVAMFRPLGVPVPSCDETTRIALNQVGVSHRDVDMLSVSPKWSHPTEYLRSITPLRLIQVAGRLGWTMAEAHRRFVRLEPVGLELAYPQVEFADEIVYWYDLQVLTTHFDGQEPVISGPVDQAYLLRAAEEIFYDAPPGDLPAKAALLEDRLRLYVPLFAFELVTHQEEGLVD